MIEVEVSLTKGQDAVQNIPLSGAIYLSEDSNFIMSNSVFEGGYGSTAGTLYSSSSLTIEITNSSFLRSYSQEGFPGIFRRIYNVLPPGN